MFNAKKAFVGILSGGTLGAGITALIEPRPLFILGAMLIGGFWGWLAYGLRDLWTKVPAAWRKTKSGLSTTYANLTPAIDAIVAWFGKPHPFIYFPTLASITTFGVLLWFLITHFNGSPKIWDLLVFSIMMPPSLWIIFAIFTHELTIRGSAKSKTYWLPLISNDGGPDGMRQKISYHFGISTEARKETYLRHLDNTGWRVKPLTYTNVVRWALIGLFTAIGEFAIGCLLVIPLAWHFVCHLFRLTHNSGRMLCATYSPIGALISLFWLNGHELSAAEYALGILFCGTLAAIWGLLMRQLFAVVLPSLLAKKPTATT